MDTYMNRVLHIDLTEQKHEVQERPDLFDKYLGGSGAALKLLLEECPKGVDPFAPENPVVLATGPLNGFFPCAVKTVAAFKSPVTGNLGESHAGGRLGISLKLAGYAAVVIKNFAEKPTRLEVDGEGVRFQDAKPLMGLSPLEVERLLRMYDVVGVQSILSTGAAGERMVFYATVNVDRYNTFGRLGLGAVFGAKNLKALTVLGCGSLAAENLDYYKKAFEEVYREVADTSKMSKYHYVGTPINVLVLNELKALPTKNFQQTTYEHAEEISGETLGERFLERKTSCPMCPIGCMHIAKLKPLFASGYEYEPVDVYYNYESIYSLGSNLYVRKAEDVLRMIYRANIHGMDTMLLGNTLAWATEAFEKGIIGFKETVDLEPKWGEVETYLKMMDRIVEMPNEFYAKMAQGVQPAAEAYGGTDFAMALCGNGLAGYHTGYAHVLGTIVGGRHSHNSNAGYDVDQKTVGKQVDRVAEKLAKEDDWRYLLTSLVVCMFSRSVYTEERVVSALRAVGVERSAEELHKLGSEVYKMAYEFKFREGFDFESVRIPRRVFETPTPNGKLDEVTLRRLLGNYVKNRFNMNLQG